MLELEEPREPATVDIAAWVRKARQNPILYRQRQVTEILLHAVSATGGLGGCLYLKGGILMALAYNSPRNTGDIDFTAVGEPEELRIRITETLESALESAIRRTGHLHLSCKVQRIVLQPRPATFADSPVPALEITIGSAARNNPREMERLDIKRSTHVVRVDLSFREPVGSMQRLLVGSGDIVQAYGLYDLIAEKLRAILQQIIRPHPGQRRQDVYDISRLLVTFQLDTEERSSVLAILRKKSRDRDFNPTREMISDPRIVSKLQAGWASLASELDETLPDFKMSFDRVKTFYEGLPWETPETAYPAVLRL